MGIVVTRIERPDAALVAGFSGLGVATVHEAQGRTGLLDPALRPIYRPAHVAGPAVTCEVAPGDNWMIHAAVEQCQAGDILVVTPTSPSEDGFFGDLVATSLMVRGVKALVINTGVRDIAILTKMGFPVWSRAISAQGTVKETVANVNVPIVCAGARVSPGDLIVADDDGVVVVERHRVAEILEMSNAREAKETNVRARLEAGELTLDIYSMRQKLADKGLRWVESLPDRQ